MRRTAKPAPPMWERIGELLAVNFSRLIAVLVAMIGVGLMGALGGERLCRQVARRTAAGAESAKVPALLKDFPGGDQAPVILVATRATAVTCRKADLALLKPPAPACSRSPAAPAAQRSPWSRRPTVGQRWRQFRWTPARPGSPSATKVGTARGRQGRPAERSWWSTSPAVGLRRRYLANAFSGANASRCWPVTGAVVALLLIVPVLWLVPLLVIAFTADRVAAVPV